MLRALNLGIRLGKEGMEHICFKTKECKNACVYKGNEDVW